MTFPAPLFTPGQLYQVIQAIAKGPSSSFAQNEKVIFQRSAYSRYDDAFVYMFYREGTTDSLEWWVYNNEPTDTWRDYFKAV